MADSGTPSRQRIIRRSVVVAVVLVAALLVAPKAADAWRGVSSFLHGTTVAPRGFDAVPDEELRATIRSMPEVRTATLEYQTNFEMGDSYDGRVHLRPGLSDDEIDSVRDRIVLVLIQGHYDAQLAVDVIPESGRSVSVDRSLDLDEGFAGFGNSSVATLLGPPAGERDWPPALAGVAADALISRPDWCAPRGERNPLCFAAIGSLPAVQPPQ
ncbi:hypothetical protein [Marmoricola endophyticus]|uniref:hypothetical protein n=1 Tax=Marmoricola endophyticus TaxID=2040280 RepID=UPI001666880D|nr:hypothetical protein [Marmoricola endophyticus]